MDKEQAEKAMREAEEKFQSSDIEGAKSMVLRAQKLFPSLPGLPQTLAAFNVHIAAASKDARGHTNWYAVLEVDPSDDIKAIKKQYKKLSLLTHPDKNRSSAAEGAFKLVVQAWETLSSKASSSEKGSTSPSEKKEKDPTGTRGSSSDSGAGDQHGSTSDARSKEKDPTGTRGSSSDSGAGDQHGSTSDARSSSRPSSAQSEPKTTWSSSARSDPKTTWSSSTRWDPKNSSSKAEVACPKCSRNCKSLDSSDLIIRCSYCNLFAVRGRRDSSIYLTIDEHGPGIFGL